MGKLLAFIFSVFLSLTVYAAPLSLHNLQQQEVSDLEGRLDTLCSTPKKGGKLEFIHFINTFDGKHIQVYFPTDTKIPASGSKIKIKKAFMLGNSSEVYATDLAMVEEPAFKYDGLGLKKVLVGIVNFADKPTGNAATLASYTTLYNKVKTGFWSQSFNNITIDSTIMDKVLLKKNTADACGGTFIYAIMDELKAEATARGLNPLDYQHYQIILPPTNSCGWCGLGSVGGPYTWINACNSYSTVGHELGHNIGLMHSNRFDNCSANDWKTGCINAEYGDGASLQGVAEGEFTAVHKQKLKWLDNVATNPQSLLVTKSGNYFIEPLETLTTGIKTLRLLRAPGEYYYVEFRQPLNYDASINTLYHKNLGIHLLMDNSTASWRLKNIGVGQSFTDPSFPGGTLTVTLLSYSSGGANIMVTLGTPPPTSTPTVNPTKTPTPTVTPTKTPTVNPTVTPTVPPGAAEFKIVPGQSEYVVIPRRELWSSVSAWIKLNGKPLVKVNTYYVVREESGKIYRELIRSTDSNGYVKFGLPITGATVKGKYSVILSFTSNKVKYVSAPTYFLVK